MKDYADQLLMESRNTIHHKATYTRKCRCWGKCFDEYKKQTQGMNEKAFLQLFGKKELDEVSCREGIITKVYYGPYKDFSVSETGIWTSIKCLACGYSNFWAVGDGDDLF